MIPKIIHQIWYQDDCKNYNKISNNLIVNYNKILKSKIPYEIKYDIMSVISKNPNYTHILWNNFKIRKFLNDKYYDLFLLYDKLELMIQKIDLAKYIILYHFGGIYVDADVRSIKSFDSFFNTFKNSGIYFSKMPKFKLIEKYLTKKFYNFKYEKDFINNGIIISKPNHKFLLVIINLIKNNINKNNKKNSFLQNVFNLTGPSFITNTIYSNLINYKDVHIIDNKYFEPCYGKDITCVLDNKTICFHKHKSLWIENGHSKMNIIIRFLFRNFFSLTSDVISFFYFLFIRNYSFIIILIFLTNYKKFIK